MAIWIDKQIQRKYFRKFPHRIKPFFKFGLRRNIGIGKEKCDLSFFRQQTLNATAGAGGTAGVKQKFFHGNAIISLNSPSLRASAKTGKGMVVVRGLPARLQERSELLSNRVPCR